MILDKPLIKQLLVNSDITIRGINNKNKSFLLQTLVEQSLIRRQDINILVRRLTLGELVKCYNELRLTSQLSSAIQYRLTQLNYIDWSMFVRLQSTSLQFLEKTLQHVDWEDVPRVYKFNDKNIERLELILNFRTLSIQQAICKIIYYFLSK